MSLPQCNEGCPQHESTQPNVTKCAYGPLTLLPHKTRVRHKKQAQVQNSQQNEFKRGRGRVQAHLESQAGSRRSRKRKDELGKMSPGGSRGGVQGGSRGVAKNGLKHEKIRKTFWLEFVQEVPVGHTPPPLFARYEEREGGG